jgi:hypothetical protein
MAPNRQPSGLPHYHRFSPYNFHNSNFLAAAKRFAELREELVTAESEAEHTHEYFVSCNLCDRANELRSQYNRFAIHFAYVWALKLIESQPPPKKEPQSSAGSADARFRSGSITPSAQPRSASLRVTQEK